MGPIAPIGPIPPPVKSDATNNSRRRNGKIARLPKKLRDLVNELLSDGATYAQIVQRLNESTDPPLPHEIFEKNISTWHDGGYQEWLQHQDRLDLLASKLDFALDLARNSQPEKLQELSLQLAAIRMCEFLSQLAIADPQTDPAIYLRLLCALPRISKEALNIQKYRDASAKSQALQPNGSNQDLAEASRNAVLDQFDNILGLKSYRHAGHASCPSPSPLNPTSAADSYGPADAPAAPAPVHQPSTINHQPAASQLSTLNPQLSPAPTDTHGHLQTANSPTVAVAPTEKPAQPLPKTWPDHCRFCGNCPPTELIIEPLPLDCQLCPVRPRSQNDK